MSNPHANHQGEPGDTGLERVRHLKRGTEYEVLGEAELQIASVDMLNRPLRLSEGARLTVYRGLDGKLWARETDEFRDGRFETIGDAPTLESSPDQTPVDPQSGWQPIKTAPKDGTPILVGWDDSYWETSKAHYEDGLWGTLSPTFGFDPLGHQPTHWMPLPATPMALAEEAALRTLQAAGEVR